MKFQKFNNIIDTTNSYIFRKAFLIFIVTGLIATPVISYFFLHDPEILLQSYFTAEKSAVGYSTEIVTDRINRVTDDTKFLSGMLERTCALDLSDSQAVGSFTGNLISLASLTKNYDQLRFLDARGNEIIRVNYKSGIPTVVEKEDLQNKDSRYYFINSINMEKDEIYISPIDLNVEKGVIEMPFKPMMRVGYQVRDKEGNLKGVFVINYSVNEMFNKLLQASSDTLGDIMLLNDSGYWLLSDKEDDQWGFQLSERDSRKFQYDYPNEWEDMKNNSSGQFLTEKGLFSYQKLYILKNGTVVTSIPKNNPMIYHYSLIVVKHIPHSIMHKLQNEKIISTLEVISVIFILACIPAWFIARIYTKNRLNQEILDLSTKYDALTKLPNFSSFQIEITRAVALAGKYHQSMALLLIELEHFDGIIDTYGKKAGDSLVVSLSNHITEKLNENSFMARIKDSTFALMIYDIKSSSEPEQAAAGIIHIAENTNAVYGKESKTSVHIGISIFPESGYETSEIIAKAEKALAHASQKGSNTFSLYTS